MTAPAGATGAADPGTASLAATLPALRAQFPDAVVRSLVVNKQAVIYVTRARAHAVFEWLQQDPSQCFDYLTDLTCVEYRDAELPLEVVYQLRSLSRRTDLRIKIPLDPEGPLNVETVTDLWAGAEWLEREAWDMFGVVFNHHLDLRRILMWETYGEGHPLRKSFPLRGRWSRSEQTRQALSANPEAHYSLEEISISEAYRELPKDMADRLATQPRGPVEMSPRTIELELSTPTIDANGQVRNVPLGVQRRPSEAVNEDFGAEHMLVNIGPQHPATHGVLRLVVELEGENVRRVIPHIGYLHSGFEKLGEYRFYNQIIPLTDRTDYLSPMANNIALALAVEAMLGIEITERCRLLRVIACEMSRIISHLVWAGTTGIDLGAFTPFLWMFEQRERIYNLQESWCGARLTTSVARVGGMVADVPEGWEDGLRAFVREFPKTLREVDTMFTRNAIWCGRTQGVGAMTAAEATNYSLSGPMLRASGVDYDVRKDRPYLGYDEFDFDVPIGVHGDVYDRYRVRLEEMFQSVRILEQALAKLKPGPVDVADPHVALPRKSDTMSDMESMIFHFKQVMEGIRPPAGEVYFGVENPKGELGYYFVSDGTAKPVRWRIRPPSFLNLAALPKMCEGALLSDVIAINASVDIVMGEIDR